MRTVQNRTLLASASENAASALAATRAPEFLHYPDDEKSAWAMASVIHCDMCRLLVAFEECEREGGVARLLCMVDLISKLYEARNWYNGVGSATLRGIAGRKPLGAKALNERLEKLKRDHQVHAVNRYEKYRNKLGFHYDAETVEHLELFANESSDDFFNVVKSFAEFSNAWAKLTKELIASQNL